ncbi:MAG: phosphatidate cytidylyltransferase [Nitrospirae bacterium]|nr:phosphatidate cytidylyltransferase [Nitrospirota bacterium]
MGFAHTTNEPETARATPRRLDSRRVYPALVFVPLFYLLVRYFPASAFFALVTAAALFALLELYRLHFRDEPNRMATGLGLGLTSLLLASLQWPTLVSERTVVLLTVIAVLLSRLFATREMKHGLADAAVLIFGVLYIGLAMGHLLLTRALAGGEFLIFFLVIVTWAGDTGAYYAGIRLGRRKLAPVISPNKTVEGLIGGLLLATLVAVGARFWFLPSFSLADCLAAGLLLTVAGTLGDLAESVLKRSAGVKDSGALIPAHGGMLDRLDSLLFAAPAFYYYVTLVKGTAA